MKLVELNKKKKRNNSPSIATQIRSFYEYGLCSVGKDDPKDEKDMSIKPLDSINPRPINKNSIPQHQGEVEVEVKERGAKVWLGGVGRTQHTGEKNRLVS